MPSSQFDTKTFLKALKNDDGNISITFGLAATILIASIGIAGDTGHALYLKNKLQTSLDASLLAGVASSTKVAEQKVAAAAHLTKIIDMPEVAYTAKFTPLKSQLKGEIEHVMKTTLLQFIGIPEQHIKVASIATASISYEPACIAAMHPTRKHTLELHDSVKLYGLNCNIYGNSDHEYDVVDPHSSENYITAKFVGAIGGGHHYIENVTPPVVFGTEQATIDINVPHLPAGACLQTGLTLTGGNTTLGPGHYCGGLSLQSNAKVTLTPGHYIISDGEFEVNGSKLSGTGVTIELRGNTPIKWEDSKITLAAPSKGAFAGLAVLDDVGQTSNLISKTEVDIHGALYMPRGEFEWENEGNFVPAAKWSAFIVDGFSWKGSGQITFNFEIKNDSIPYPDALNAIPMPGEVRLVR